MAKFLFVYRNDTDNMDLPSPEEMQEVMAAWGAWFDKMGDAIIDGGDGLMPEGKTVAADGAVTDGPFMEGKELLGGYSVVQADSLDEAVEMAQGCPIRATGGSIEIRQLAGLSDQQGE